MGLYFNTDASMEMLEIVNGEFQATNLAKWRRRKDFFDRSSATYNSLDAIADFFKVHPKKNPNKKARWLGWLQYLYSQPSPSLSPYPLPPLADITYPIPSSTETSTVGAELSQLIYLALNDANCSEILFLLLPDPKVRVVSARTIQPSEGGYSLVLTISTIELPQKIKARLIKKLKLTPQMKAALK